MLPLRCLLSRWQEAECVPPTPNRRGLADGNSRVRIEDSVRAQGVRHLAQVPRYWPGARRRLLPSESQSRLSLSQPVSCETQIEMRLLLDAGARSEQRPFEWSSDRTRRARGSPRARRVALFHLRLPDDSPHEGPSQACCPPTSSSHRTPPCGAARDEPGVDCLPVEVDRRCARCTHERRRPRLRAVFPPVTTEGV
jgi:hypothetical protein